MRVIDIAADHLLTLAEGVAEGWHLGPGEGAPDANRHAIPVIHPGGIEEVEAMVRAHRSAGGIEVVAICPNVAGKTFPLVPWAVSPLPEFCAREEIALMISCAGGDAFPWADVVAFARAYPRLAVVAPTAPLDGPAAGKALDATANLIFASSGARLPAAAASLAATRGAHRMAYGSGSSPHAIADVVASLDSEAAELVASGTAGHLAAGTWSTTFL